MLFDLFLLILRRNELILTFSWVLHFPLCFWLIFILFFEYLLLRQRILSFLWQHIAFHIMIFTFLFTWIFLIIRSYHPFRLKYLLFLKYRNTNRWASIQKLTLSCNHLIKHFDLIHTFCPLLKHFIGKYESELVKWTL